METKQKLNRKHYVAFPSTMNPVNLLTPKTEYGRFHCKDMSFLLHHSSVSPPNPLLTVSDSDNIDGGFSVLKVCSSVYSQGYPAQTRQAHSLSSTDT